MYCLRHLDEPRTCHTCRQPVAAGLAGYYYNHPLCQVCFRECDPLLAALLSAAESLSCTSLQASRGSGARTCASCSHPMTSWILGRHRQGLLCRRCFQGLDPHLGSVLILEKGVRTLVEDRAPSSQYLELVRHYVDARARLND
jgi:hypothetical protein